MVIFSIFLYAIRFQFCKSICICYNSLYSERVTCLEFIQRLINYTIYTDHTCWTYSVLSLYLLKLGLQWKTLYFFNSCVITNEVTHYNFNCLMRIKFSLFVEYISISELQTIKFLALHQLCPYIFVIASFQNYHSNLDK